MTMAEVLIKKGRHDYGVERVSRMIESLGYEEMILKSDQEHSVMALKAGVRDRVAGTVRFEESPVGEHQANGDAENAVQRIQGQFRTIKYGLECRIGSKDKGRYEDHTMDSEACGRSPQ